MPLRVLIVLVAIAASTGCIIEPPDPVKFDVDGKPKTCQPCSYVGQAGVCVQEDNDFAKSALADRDLKKLIDLSRDQCPQHEVCLYCRDPRDGEDTGICDQGIRSLICPLAGR